MATRIRLRRVGRKKQPEYRIVVAESTAAGSGRVVATIGHYAPRAQPVVVKVNVDQARDWISRGATPSDTARSLLKQAGVFGDASVVAAVAVPEAPATPEAPEAPAASDAPAEG